MIDKRRLDELRAIRRPGSPSLLERAIGLFRQESAELLERLERAVHAVQAEETRAAAHKLKSICGSLGAETAFARCQELENLAREERLGESEAVLGRLRLEIERASQELSEELATPTNP